MVSQEVWALEWNNKQRMKNPTIKSLVFVFAALLIGSMIFTGCGGDGGGSNEEETNAPSTNNGN